MRQAVDHASVLLIYNNFLTAFPAKRDGLTPTFVFKATVRARSAAIDRPTPRPDLSTLS
jgi:hypothetical protein